MGYSLLPGRRVRAPQGPHSVLPRYQRGHQLPRPSLSRPPGIGDALCQQCLFYGDQAPGGAQRRTKIESGRNFDKLESNYDYHLNHLTMITYKLSMILDEFAGISPN